MNVKFCPNCGQRMPATARFCPKCGAEQPEQSGQNSTTIRQSNKDTKNANNKIHSQSAGSYSTPSRKQFYRKHAELDNTLTRNNTENSVYRQSFYDENHGNETRQSNFYEDSQSEDYMNDNGNWYAYNESRRPGLENSFRLWWTSIDLKKCMGRADFWWGYLGIIILWILLIIIGILILLMFNLNSSILIWLRALGGGLGGITYCAEIERLHDTGHSGWNWIWNLTGIGAFYVLYLLCQPTNWNEKRWARP